MEMKKLGITQELLSLVTGLAHYLKNLIRVTLNAALRLVYYPLERKRTCVLIYIYYRKHYLANQWPFPTYWLV